MSDLIYREDALMCLTGEYPADFKHDKLIAKFIRRIRKLPPAQPEIIRCKDCKHNVSSHKCLHPESFFLVPSDDFYCGFAERRINDK